MDKYTLSFVLRMCFEECHNEALVRDGGEVGGEVGGEGLKGRAELDTKKGGATSVSMPLASTQPTATPASTIFVSVPIRPSTMHTNRSPSTNRPPSIWIGHILRYLRHCRSNRDQRDLLTSAVCQKVRVNLSLYLSIYILYAV